MALHNLKIIVVDGGNSNSYKSKNAGEKEGIDKNSDLYKVLHSKQTIINKIQEKTSPATAYVFNMGIQLTSQMVKQNASYYISNIGRKNGDSSLQEHLDRELEIVTDVTGTIGNALSGATTGGMFGPIGMAIGTMAGLASSAISIGFRQSERERAFNFKEFNENNSIEYQRARASISLTTGRLR